LRLRRNAASSSSVGFRSLAYGSRHEASLPITRFLAAIASPLATGATLNSRSCRRPPAPLGWGSLTARCGIWHSLSRAGAALGLPLPSPLFPAPPKGHRAECHRARAFRTRGLFKVTGLPAQSAFSWLDLALRPGEPRSPYRSEERFAPRTPLSLPLDDPPCHGDGSPPTAISNPPSTFPPPRRRKPPRKGCTRERCLSPTSAADFCCHEHPLGSQLPSPRLASPGPPRPARSLCRRLSASSKTEPSSTMSNSRFRHLRPWVVTWLTPRLPAAATCAALPETPAASGVDPRQRSRLSASPVRWLHTPPVAIPAPPGEPAGPRTTRTRFHCCTSMRQLSRTRGVFHRQVPQVPSVFSLERCPTSRHWYPGFATVSPASDMRSRPRWER